MLGYGIPKRRTPGGSMCVTTHYRRSLYDHFMVENDQPRPTLDGQESFTIKRFLDATNIYQSV
jgi:hypothetical protein